MIKETIKDANGTSFHGTTITTTPRKLVELFPRSYSEQNNGEDKCNFDFVLENSDEDVFTIYDWKEYRPIGMDEQIEFHIGGNSKSITEKSKRQLLPML
jgi:hypothetical protein